MTLALPPSIPGQRVNLRATGQGFDVVRLRDAATVGSVRLNVAAEELVVHSLCIDEPHRSYGAGSESARLLLEAAEAAGFVTVRAWAHPSLGLSAYFWIRMGLTPLHGEGPEGGIWYEWRRTVP